LTLGKQYVQDEALEWGFLTQPEHGARCHHGGEPAAGGTGEAPLAPSATPAAPAERDSSPPPAPAPLSSVPAPALAEPSSPPRKAARKPPRKPPRAPG
ncbi:MAG: hypothetical protein ACKOJF_03975, partial [Planctomycetaceae bacterium]